ncbi:MAG: hypothetical protein HYU99_07890 [Deltaproteobacteria bacterium]|nr:hypothetical protein [Deltaproteobacteria bacterium]
MKPFLLALLVSFTLASCASVSSGAKTGSPQKTVSATKSKKVRSEAGLNIPSWGVAIDAVYDKRLDNLVPGYKIINVVLSNRGPVTISLDPTKDVWFIRDSVGKSHRAVNHLRFASEKLWLSLPVGLKDKLEYPHAVRTGNSTKIDLFFPENAELSGFREISWKSDHFRQTFDIYTAMEKNLDWDSKSEKIPDTPAYRQSIEKYEGELRKEDNQQEPADMGQTAPAGPAEPVQPVPLTPEEETGDTIGSARPGYEILSTDPADTVSKPTAQTTHTTPGEQSPQPFDPWLDDEVTTIPMD